MAYVCTKTEMNRLLRQEEKEFVCDSVDDIAALPECCAGSMAMVVAEGGLVIYMKNASGVWVVV